MTVLFLLIVIYMFISTHTLTWSVTILAKRHINHANISTHTLTWSVTIKYSLLNLLCLDFNSHAHVERDTEPLPVWANLGISTHTLTWSVTNVALKNSATQAISTHTLTWSVTEMPDAVENDSWISTHTLTWSVTIPQVQELP